MRDTKVTVASLTSLLGDVPGNLRRVESACVQAARDGARMLFLPELMLTGHGAHPKMAQNAEPVPDGPLCQAMTRLSREHNLCICVGLAERDRDIVYNSQIVIDRGEYLGRQRKVSLSGDEYCTFGPGQSVPIFDIGELRFGIIICYDNLFPELALLLGLDQVDLILSPHAARTGDWPEEWTPSFCTKMIQRQQESWEQIHRARAFDHNAHVLLCNAVGPSTEGLEDVVANHAGTVMGIDPKGEVFLRTSVTEFVDEIVTVALRADKRQFNHAPTRNRRLPQVLRMMERSLV